MRLILLAAIALPLAAVCQSKKSPVTFGKVDKEELLLKTCEFDPNAEAMVIYENAHRYFDIMSGHPQSELRHHVRTKIFSEKGRENADVHIRYISKNNSEGIGNLVAQTYNLDEAGNVVVTKVEKAAVYQKKLNNLVSEVSFTFPNVKPGSIIEYKYVWKGYYRRNWTLQKSIPVKFSRYEIDFPKEFDVHTKPFCTLPFASKDESSSLRSIKVFSMENLPGLRDEQYITCDEDYLQRVESWVLAFYYEGRRYPFVKSWPELAKLLTEHDDLGMQLKKDIPRTEELELKLKSLTDPYSKMVAIHNYVRNYMRWDGTESYWAASGVKSAWKEKTGTSGEINLILINLLRDAGLSVHPLMVSTRTNGRVSPFYNDVSQFNKVLAYVKIGEKKYVLDGTDKFTPASVIPYDVMYTEGLLLDPSQPHGFVWVELWDDKHLEKNVVAYQAVVNEKGQVKGHATISSSDYARIKRVHRLADKKEYMERFLQHGKFNLEIDSFKVKNEQTDTLPLIQDVDFHGVVNNSGEYSFINTNMFAGIATNPFIADSRFSDVFFGTKQSYTIISNVRIPEGYSFEEPPKNIKMTLQDNSLVVTRMSQINGNMINSRITVDFHRPFYTPEEYPDLKEFYKKMYSLLDEQVVFKKNSIVQTSNP